MQRGFSKLMVPELSSDEQVKVEVGISSRVTAFIEAQRRDYLENFTLVCMSGEVLSPAVSGKKTAEAGSCQMGTGLGHQAKEFTSCLQV